LSLWHEFKRRNVFRVAGIYLAAAWLIVQIVSAIAEPLSLPDWFDTVVILLLAGGFPVALLVAWALELTPDGVRLDHAEQSAHRQRTPTVPFGRALDFAIIGVLALALAVTVFDRPAPAPDNSIAVLRFTNQTENADQAYLSNSIPSEILNRLIPIDGLRLVGENSSFQFAVGDGNYDAIGTALNVAYVLEGTFLKLDDRIRVRPRLVRATDGVAVWSDDFDGTGNDIFSILPDIAIAVANTLSVELGVREQEIRYFGTNNELAYEHYSRGRLIWLTAPQRAIDEFLVAARLDPSYAEPWAWMSNAHGVLVGQENSQTQVDERFEQMKNSALRAVELGPDLPDAHNSLAWARMGESDWIGAQEAMQTAQALARAAGTTQGWRAATFIESFGHMAEGERILADILEDDPLNIEAIGFRLTALEILGRYEELRAAWERAGVEFLPSIGARFWFMEQGDVDGVQSVMAGAAPDTLESRLSGAIASREDTLRTITDWLNESQFHKRSELVSASHWAGFYDDPELAVQLLRAAFLTNGWGNYLMIWHDVLSETRQTPQFKQFVIDLGLADYWHRTGDWNDYCQSLPGDDEFECV
jgi:adenylate cyclase